MTNYLCFENDSSIHDWEDEAEKEFHEENDYCKQCGGTGQSQFEVCTQCGGSGLDN